MRRICFVLLALLAPAQIAQAQRPEDFQIRWGLYTTKADGGEKAAGAWFVNPVTIDKAATGTFSAGARCDAWAVSARTGLREGAITAWRIETTPLRVSGEAVTFRLRWMHFASLRQQLDQVSFDNAGALRLPGDDIELTLRPGESWEVDRFSLPGGADIRGKPCPLSASIRVSVEFYPGPDEEQGLVAADLWLVERLPNGSEVPRSQPVTVRGLPYRPFRFYFDRLVDGEGTLDVYGILNARPGSGAMAVAVETRSRWTPEKRNIAGPQRFLNSDLQLKPDETVEIRLPLLGDEAGVFAKRSLSIRIRARQLR